MTGSNVGFLHPGEMGISLAASAQNSGHAAYWVSTDRSRETHERADRFSLMDVGTIEQLCDECAVIVSVCPPHAAENVAIKVSECSYAGVYLDVNAISPQRAQRIADRMERAGAKFVDGGVVGGPAWKPGSTQLFLSGAEAEAAAAAACFSAGPLETIILGDQIGSASALKMCFAANSKGTTALLCATLTVAEGLGVRAELEEIWSRDGSDFAERTRARVVGVTKKAWRFVGELDEIATTFEESGLPGEFHSAGAEVYRRLSSLKDTIEAPDLEEVLAALVSEGDA